MNQNQQETSLLTAMILLLEDPFFYESSHFSTKKKKVHVSIWQSGKTNCGYMANQQCWSNSPSMEMLLQNRRRNRDNPRQGVSSQAPEGLGHRLEEEVDSC